MLKDIEDLTYNYLHSIHDNWFIMGLRGIHFNTPSSDYLIGLFEGLHFHMLLHALLKENKKIKEPEYEFITTLIDEKDALRYQKKEKFIFYIIKYMNYSCCKSYIWHCTIMPKNIQLAILEHMVNLLKLEK